MVSSIFRRSAKRDDRDLSHLNYREPIGITADVIKSYHAVYAPQETAIGLRGFRFKQYGLSYEIFYKDPQGNDVPKFVVTCPSGQPYFHLSGTIGIVEKAHALMVAKELIEKEQREGLRRHIYALEKACFDDASGRLVRGLTGLRNFPNGEKITAYIGLKFPDDGDYQLQPELNILAIEWIKANKHMMIDNSGLWPEFTKGSDKNPDGLRFYMTRSEAKSAIEHVRNHAKVFHKDLEKLAGLTRFWERSEDVAEWLSTVSTAVPKPSP